MPGARKADPYDRAVALRVRALRLARGMSQSELGRQLGVSFQQVQKYENGANRIGAGRLQRVAGIFEVPLAALFGAPRLRRKADADPLDALRSAGAMRLLQAYNGIHDGPVRRSLVRLAEEIAARSP